MLPTLKVTVSEARCCDVTDLGDREAVVGGGDADLGRLGRQESRSPVVFANAATLFQAIWSAETVGTDARKPMVMPCPVS